MSRPGPKPIYATRREAIWVARMKLTLATRGGAVDVFMTREPCDIQLRTVRLRRKSKALPAGAEFVGRYSAPFVPLEFLGDLAVHLAMPPARAAA